MTKPDTCPRCGQPVIEVTDMGRLGKLFVHRYEKIPQLPVPNKVACSVSADELANGLRWTRGNADHT